MIVHARSSWMILKQAIDNNISPEIGITKMLIKMLKPIFRLERGCVEDQPQQRLFSKKLAASSGRFCMFSTSFRMAVFNKIPYFIPMQPKLLLVLAFALLATH